MDKILGLSMPFKVGTRVVEVHPILLKDWPKFAKVVGVLELATLQEIYFYSDGPTLLFEAAKLVCRLEEVPELLYDVTQADYERLRNMIMEQNGLDFTTIREDIKKKDGRVEELLNNLLQKKE